MGDAIRGLSVRFQSGGGRGLPHQDTVDRGMIHHSHGTRHDHEANSKGFAAGLHGERLHRMVVFELREDGSTAYHNMTLRSLYNSVVRTITDNCRMANREKVREQRREAMQVQEWMGGGQQQSSGGTGEDGADVVGIGQRQRQRDEGVEIANGIHRGTGSIGAGPAVVVVDRRGGVEGSHQEESGDHVVGGGGPSASGVGPSPTSPPITPSSFVPPHYLPSLTSPNDVRINNSSSFPTPIKSNRSASSDDDGRIIDHPLQQQHDGQRQQHSLQRPGARHVRSVTSPIIRSGSTGGVGIGANNRATYRERLGGYLHPRDMRRLVTPFSSSNEPQLIVRRHAMLLNFDPLRAIVLKDRLLVLVPDGADSLLIALERRVRGGVAEMTDQVFGGGSEHDPNGMPPKMKKDKSREGLADSLTEGDDYSDHDYNDDAENDEWQDMQKMDWQTLPFDLQSVDAILQTVTSMLLDDVKKVHLRAEHAMKELRGDSPNKKGGGSLTDYAQERLRLHKDEVNLMDRRVRGFVRAINQVLDEDEDMTLMNLSRLLTHPERFMQPVPQEVLEEESDEPELILETHLQQALSIVNALDLLTGQIKTTQEQINMTLDALRNRLLFINTLLSLATFCVTIGSYVGALFGMNITNPLQDRPDSSNFLKVAWGTSSGVVCLCGILAYIFYWVTNTPTFKSFPHSGK
jgi:magnesium transporter